MLERWKKKTGSADYQQASGVMRDSFVRVVNEDLRPLLAGVGAPTLLLWGEYDTATPRSDGQLMQKMMPDAGLVTLKNGTHYAFLEKINEFLIIADKFLEKDKN